GIRDKLVTGVQTCALPIYRLVKTYHDVRLVLAGTADEESERVAIRDDLLQAAREDPDIVVLELPAEAHRQINALQRAATIVLQRSEERRVGKESVCHSEVS